MTTLSPMDHETLRVMRRYRRELGNFRRSVALFYVAFSLSAAALLGAAGATFAAPIEPSPQPVAQPVTVGSAESAAVTRPTAAAFPDIRGNARAQALAVRDDPRVAFAMLLSLFVVTAALAGLFWRRMDPSRDKRDPQSGDAGDRYLDG